MELMQEKVDLAVGGTVESETKSQNLQTQTPNREKAVAPQPTRRPIRHPLPVAEHPLGQDEAGEIEVVPTHLTRHKDSSWNRVRRHTFRSFQGFLFQHDIFALFWINNVDSRTNKP